MLGRVIDLWRQTTLQQKISLIKQIAIETVIIVILAAMFFWCTFLFTWGIALLIGVQPYHQTFAPNFHVRNVMPNRLLTLFVNQDMKSQTCLLSAQDLFFSQLTVPYHEYCNIEQEHLPRMRALVDISISEVDIQKISYVSGCIKHKGKQASCQKYPSFSSFLLFRSVDFYELYYVQIELHFKKQIEPDSISYMPKIEFEQKCWFITKIIKKYYSVFMLVFSSIVTFLLTISAILYRIIKIIEKSNRISQVQKQKPISRVPASVVKTTSSKIVSKQNLSSGALIPERDAIRSRVMQKQQQGKKQMIKQVGSLIIKKKQE